MTSQTEQSVDVSVENLIQLYQGMLLSRKVDERQRSLKRQQKTYFQLSCAGHEALLVAAGLVLKPGVDWVYPYYRDQALCLMLGMTAEEVLLEAAGAGAAPFSGGRQMPNHWGSPRLHIASRSSSTGMHFLHGVGCAEATSYFTRHPSVAFDNRLDHDPSEITCVLSGEGSTSQGEFWEALSAASLGELPVLFVIEDNGYAISVPVEAQTPGGDISRLIENFPRLLVRKCDGIDPVASYRALSEAADYCRSGVGPALVHARVLRLHPHSNSDDDRMYRRGAELEAELARDPLPRFREYLVNEQFVEEATLTELERQVEDEVSQAAAVAVNAEPPNPTSVLTAIYSDVDPTSSEFSHPAQGAGDPQTMIELINRCLADELGRDERVICFGEDVADLSQDDLLVDLKGKGGVFKATAGLQRIYGSDRVWNTPIAEAGIVGRAIGLALRGLKPIVEIQFFDYIWPAMMQIRNELSNMRWRSKGHYTCPVVIRAPSGGYLRGGGVYHSQSGEVVFSHVPGLRVVMPSNALDANGLLRTAIRSDDPVLFLEPKHLYRQVHNRGVYPGPDYMVPFGSASVVREGSDLTVVTYGSTVVRSIQAAERLSQESGMSVEVLDLRSLSPYDWSTIRRSVEKTSRVLVVYEDWLSWGYGAEIAARISDELFSSLDAPVRRVGAQDSFCAYSPTLEDEILPQVSDIETAVRELMAI